MTNDKTPLPAFLEQYRQAAPDLPAFLAKCAQPPTERPVITVYVRKGQANDERWLSFNVPDDLDQFDLLKRGLAIDGNQAMFSISPIVEEQRDDAGQLVRRRIIGYTGAFVDPDETHYNDTLTTLPEALHHAELGLAEFLQTQGFRVIFR